jgi:hypothetical protein
MTSIKPPDPRAAERLGSSTPGEAGQAPDAPGASFREVLQGGTPAQATARPEVATPTGSAEAPSALAQAIRAGTISADQALDQLVERAVATGPLTDPQRAELRALLAEALQSDPALRELRENLSK